MTVPTQHSSRAVLRYVYLLSAVTAITCAGLAAVFSWRHLHQHAIEAGHSQYHLATLQEIAAMQAALLDGAASNDGALIADGLNHLQSLQAQHGDAHHAEHLRSLAAAWDDLDASLAEESTGADAPVARPEALATFIAELDALRLHESEAVHQMAHTHGGAQGLAGHMLVAGVLLLLGALGVSWLLTAIVRSQRALEQAHASLEHKVAQRTAQLEANNLRLSQEIDRRRQLEEEIVTIASEEQQRIAHALHDDLGQQLAGLALSAKHLERALSNVSPERADDAGQLSRQVRGATESLRQIVRGLYPSTLTAAELQSALGALAAETSARYGSQCRFTACGELSIDDGASNVQLFGIAREAIANAVRHGGAGEVDVELGARDGWVELLIRDNGSGFDPDAGRVAGVGLRLMRHRADVLGAEFKIESSPGRGAIVRVRFPATGPAQ